MTTSASELARILAVSFLLVAVAGSSDAGDLETDGAFVSTKISGPALAVSGTDKAPWLNADSLDGLDGSSLPRSPANIVSVAKTGGHFQSLENALAAISYIRLFGGAGTPYVVVIGPGEFSSESHIEIPHNVHLQGSGPSKTMIVNTNGWPTLSVHHTATISDLSVHNLGGSGLVGLNDSLAILVAGTSADLTLRNVDVFSKGTGVGVRSGGQVRGRNVAIDISANFYLPKALRVDSDSEATFEKVSITVTSSLSETTTLGVDAQGALFLDHCEIEIKGPFSSAVALEIDGPATIRATAVVLDLRNSTGPSGTIEGFALRLSSDAVTDFRHGEILVRGQGGIAIRNSSHGATVAHTKISAVESDFSPVSNEGELTIFQSLIFGKNSSLSTGSGALTRAIHSVLGGSTAGGGSNICRWVTDGTFATFPTSCP